MLRIGKDNFTVRWRVAPDASRALRDYFEETRERAFSIVNVR